MVSHPGRRRRSAPRKPGSPLSRIDGKPPCCAGEGLKIHKAAKLDGAPSVKGAIGAIITKSLKRRRQLNEGEICVAEYLTSLPEKLLAKPHDVLLSGPKQLARHQDEPGTEL